MVQKSADYFLFLLFISVRYFFSVYWALSLCQMLQQEQQGCGVLETSAVWWTRIKELRRKGRHRNKKGGCLEIKGSGNQEMILDRKVSEA